MTRHAGWEAAGQLAEETRHPATALGPGAGFPGSWDELQRRVDCADCQSVREAAAKNPSLPTDRLDRRLGGLEWLALVHNRLAATKPESRPCEVRKPEP